MKLMKAVNQCSIILFPINLLKLNLCDMKNVKTHLSANHDTAFTSARKPTHLDALNQCTIVL